jgi:5-hydroxyisourate hydrolase-like protein (transthyretin family)
VKLYVLTAFAVLSLVSLCACGGGNTTSGITALPAAHAINPLTNSVEVTAVMGGKPISGLTISVTRKDWPGGKLIAKGKTGAKGRVKLSGNWTNQELICAGGRLNTPSGFKERSSCSQPFPKTITLRF